MQLEIQVALNFIISYLYNKLPRRRVNIFSEELERRLSRKYQGHWYPERPFRGSGFRCISVGEKVDLVIEEAARESGLNIDDVRENLPRDLSVWIDPFEVSYQIGEQGALKLLYVEETTFNPEAQVFTKNSLSGSSSPSPPPSSPSFTPRSTQALTFTTASFATTKFGSTKIKTGTWSAKLAQSSPTNAKANGALSPNAQEFVFPQGAGATPASEFSYPLDMLATYTDRLLAGGLSCSLGNLQLQPVMAS